MKVNGFVMTAKNRNKMDPKEIEAIEIIRALDGKIMKKYQVSGFCVYAFSEKQAKFLFSKDIIRKKETDVGIFINGNVGNV